MHDQGQMLLRLRNDAFCRHMSLHLLLTRACFGTHVVSFLLPPKNYWRFVSSSKRTTRTSPTPRRTAACGSSSYTERTMEGVRRASFEQPISESRGACLPSPCAVKVFLRFAPGHANARVGRLALLDLCHRLFLGCSTYPAAGGVFLSLLSSRPCRCRRTDVTVLIASSAAVCV